MIPETRAGWTLDAIRSVVSSRVFEARTFDFKETLPPSGDERGKLRLRKTLAAFANRPGGGFLIIGVKDDRGLDTDARIVGVDLAVDLPEHLKPHATACVPHVRWEFQNPPHRLSSGKVVHVVEVFEGTTKPHGVFDGEKWIFPKRTDGGNDLLSYEELRDAFRDQHAVRTQFAVIKAEADRMARHGERINGGFAHGFGAEHLPLLFRPSLLESALLQIVATIQDDAELLNELGTLRSTAWAADTEATRLLVDGGKVDKLVRLARIAENSARRVSTSIARRLADRVR